MYVVCQLMYENVYGKTPPPRFEKMPLHFHWTLIVLVSILIRFVIFIIISVVIFVYLSLATLAVYKDTYAAYEPSNKNWFYKNHFTRMNYLKNYSILNLKWLRLWWKLYNIHIVLIIDWYIRANYILWLIREAPQEPYKKKIKEDTHNFFFLSGRTSILRGGD